MNAEAWTFVMVAALLYGPWVGALVGLVALVSNAASMAAGRDVFGELPLAGSSGVLATVLLALCLLALPDSE